jgi:hypothetical protein
MKNNIYAYGLAEFLAVSSGDVCAGRMSDFIKAPFGSIFVVNPGMGLVNGGLRAALFDNVPLKQVYPVANLFVQKILPVSWLARFTASFLNSTLWQQSMLGGAGNMSVLGLPFAICKLGLIIHDSEKNRATWNFKIGIALQNKLALKLLALDACQITTLVGSMALAGAPLSVCAVHFVIPAMVSYFIYKSKKAPLQFPPV